MKKSPTQIDELRQSSFFNWITVLLFVFFLVLTIIFSFLLNQQTGNGFGITVILFDLGLTVVITLALTWVRSVMITNPYLGLAIAALGLLASIYSLFLKYQGPYTIAFASIAAVAVVIYTVVYFFKYRALQN